MERLSEELLDYIISEVGNPLPSRHNVFYNDLLNLSMISRKFRRIAEPYLYHSVVLSESNEEAFLRMATDRAALPRYIRHIFMTHFHTVAREVWDFATHLPNLHKLDLDITSCKLSDILPALQLPSITELRLSGAAARQIPGPCLIDWDVVNTAIICLDVSFADPENWWEDCDEIWKFAAVFRGLRSLSLHGDYEPERTYTLNGPVFRCLVHAFKRSFETTLRSFSFGYNDVNHGHMHQGDLSISDALDAREILKQSQLENLKIDTMCLHKPMQPENLRSLELGPSCLPPSLRTLYVRHLVAAGNLNPTERNLMHSDEAQCLSQLVNLGTRRTRFPHLSKMTLAISLPSFFEEIASRIVKVQARKVKIRLDLVLM